MKTDNIAVSRDLIAGPRFYEQECRTLREINSDLLAALEAMLRCESADDRAAAIIAARAAIARARGTE